MTLTHGGNAGSLSRALFRSTPAPRTFEKVWRDSLPKGDFEAEIWRPADKSEMGIALAAAEAFDKGNKAAGQRNGPLGHVALQVYTELWRALDFATGRLDPSIAYLMRETRRSRRAVVEALKRLWRHGLVRWLRRMVETGRPGIRGPQVQQATNAYQLRPLAAEMLALLPPSKRARYRPKAAPRPPSAGDLLAAEGRRQKHRGKMSRAVRAYMAMDRIDDAIRAWFTAQGLARLAAHAAKAQRESTEADQNPLRNPIHRL